MAEVKVGDRIKLSCRQDVEGISEYDGKIFKVEELNDEDCVLSHEDYDLPIVIPYMYCTFRKVIDDNQSAKADTGKLRLTLVPRKIIFEIAKIREYGCKKYKALITGNELRFRGIVTQLTDTLWHTLIIQTELMKKADYHTCHIWLVILPFFAKWSR